MSFQDLEVSKARIQSNQVVDHVLMAWAAGCCSSSWREDEHTLNERLERKAAPKACHAFSGQRLQLINSEIGIIHWEDFAGIHLGTKDRPTMSSTPEDLPYLRCQREHLHLKPWFFPIQFWAWKPGLSPIDGPIIPLSQRIRQVM